MSQKSIFNSPVILSVSATLAKIGFGLLIILISSKRLTIEETNLLLFILTVVSLSQVAQLGFNVTFLRYFSYNASGVSVQNFRRIRCANYRYSEKNCKKQFSILLFTAKRIYTKLSILLLFFLITIGSLLYLKPASYLNNPDSAIIYWVLVVFSIAISFYFSLFRIVLEGIQRIVFVQKILLAHYLLASCLLALLSYFTPSMLLILIILQGVQLSSSLTMYIAAGLQLKQGGYEVSYATDTNYKRYFKLVWTNSKKSGFTQLIALCSKYSVGLIGAQLFDPRLSASFLFTFKLFETIEAIVAAVVSAKNPEMIRVRGKGLLSEYRSIVKNVERLGFLLYVIGYITLIMIVTPALSYFDSNLELLPSSIIAILSYAFIFNRLTGIQLNCTNHANYVIEHKAAFIYFVVFLLGLCIGSFYFGIYAIPLALFFAAANNMLFVLPKTYEVYGEDFWSFERMCFIPVFFFISCINIIYLSWSF